MRLAAQLGVSLPSGNSGSRRETGASHPAISDVMNAVKGKTQGTQCCFG